MDPRFAQLPSALRSQTLITRLGPDGAIPALLTHPAENWHSGNPAPKPAPVVLWFHGRTAHKELDPGRYLRWLRAPLPDGTTGIAACAIDLPGHGERLNPADQQPDRSMDVLRRAVDEIDLILADLAHPHWNGAFDLTRAAIGGMSAGGMVTLARLCRPHSFKAAAVEATAGSFDFMRAKGLWTDSVASELEPIRHIDGWRPISLLAIHSEADQWVPVSAIRDFTTKLADHYRTRNANPAQVTLHTWPTTGAPNEHYGFGKVSNEAKNLQTEFLARVL